ncbi:S8 family serine peptidase [Ramlibacter sp.]|uniref:S8 family serine peptidase n=1 Tax=Ramlibacter sp. TaxID=1917967 RepID=UPI0017DE117D|nr:S8 family serine peptidase [Ramlibacter sp.]MBA2674460.1 S8 family serine peptidase [Ramlibacter sp.]
MPLSPSPRTAAAALTVALGALSAAAVHAQPVRGFAASQPIPDRYIVVFKKDVPDHGAEAAGIVRGAGGQLHHVYGNALKGFTASLPARVLQGLRNNPHIESIEQDQTVALSATENQATWGLDRIDQADRPLDTVYSYNATGSGVYAFIIDTGIRADHAEFTGRVLPGTTSISDGNGTNDCNGHGTHVSGTVGGTVYGVAKQVKLIPVRVLDCSGSGSWSGVIAGIDWAANSSLRPAVANLSLGGGRSSSVNAAVAGAVAKGVVMAVAAGNDNANACNTSPASEPSAITVGATTSADARASYSNYGSCVDVFAPGSGITSAWNTGPTATNTISGTSMATPHVAGVAALVLQSNPGATPAAVAAWITANATPNRVSLAGTGSPNLLLYALGGGTPTPPAVQTIAVKSLSGITSKTSPKAWRATATVAVRDVASGAALAGATVSATFSPGGAASCATDGSGSCAMSTDYAATVSGATFTVTGMAGPNMAYDANANAATQLVFISPIRK